MKHRRRHQHAPNRPNGDPRTGRRVRPLARSLVLYAVLGTLALHAAPAPHAFAQDGAPSPPQRGEVQDRRQPNTRAFRELLAKARRMRERGELNLDGAASLAVEADMNDDGSLSNQTSAFNGDDSLRGLAQEFVRALDESRVLAHLKGVRHVRVTLALDGQNFTARADADTDTPEQAAQMARTHDALFAFARIANRGREAAVVYNNLTATASGKQLVLNLNLTREALGNLLFKQVTPN
ncbi:MAG TPA: hypothetical protein VGV38_19080 [Pyrinomonadaceae bacterium]|nr:hypothetical protein [Pyrinomonadaceae bacterium]